MELRRRNVLAVEEDDASPAPRVVRALAQADFFSKPKEDFKRSQTKAGAYLSTATAALLIILVLYETARYTIGWDSYRTELSVDTNVQGTVPFEFDISFPAIKCHDLTIDSLDASGDEQNDVAHDLYKSPVDHSGRVVVQSQFNYVERRFAVKNTPTGLTIYDPERDPKHQKFCGSCYVPPPKRAWSAQHRGEVHVQRTAEEARALGKHSSKCCNTCESVMEFYRDHLPSERAPLRANVEQCVDEISRANPGCNLRGTLHLRKVKGNFHFAPGHGAQLGPFGMHLHTFSITEALRFNVSHKIHKFRIGDPSVPRFSKRGVKFPIEGESATISRGVGVVKYYISVVPTMYRRGALKLAAYDHTNAKSNAESTANEDVTVPDGSYEYSAQKHVQTIPMEIFGRTPGLYFVYDFESMQVHHVFERPPFSRFLVKLCSIVGGLFVVLGLADRIVAYIVTNKLVPERFSHLAAQAGSS